MEHKNRPGAKELNKKIEVAAECIKRYEWFAVDDVVLSND
jgi:hypothetical protein